MIMEAVVIDVQWERLLVLDLDARQKVIVNTPEAQRFRPGDFVRIWYNGVMTRSIPPRITALHIAAQPPSSISPPVFLPPVVRPPVVFPPVIRPPVVVFPPIGRPPFRHGHRPPRHRR